MTGEGGGGGERHPLAGEATHAPFEGRERPVGGGREGALSEVLKQGGRGVCCA